MRWGGDMKGKATLKIAFVAGIGILSNAAFADTIIQKWSGEFLIVSNAEAKRIFDLNLTGFLVLPALADRPTVITAPRKSTFLKSEKKKSRTVIEHKDTDSIFIRLERENAN